MFCNRFATLLFIIFMFLVVILLANVLIAIVTDSYKVIQDQRAAIVFWTNRVSSAKPTLIDAHPITKLTSSYL